MLVKSKTSFWFDVLIGPLVGMVHRPAMTLADPSPGERVLEVGVGTALQLRRYRGDDRLLVGLDHDPGMLGRALENLKGEGALIIGDGTRLPFPGDSFDLVLCSLMIHEMPPASRPLLLAEARRVLSRSGRILIIDFGTSIAGTLNGRLVRRAIRAIERRVGGDHYENFLDYVQRGGLSPLIAQSALEIVGENEVGDGAIRMVLLKRAGMRSA